VTIAELNALPDEAAGLALARCCGAQAWVAGMRAARPFRDRAGLFEAADRVAAGLGRSDWLEAFAHHPRIDDRETQARRFAATATWAGDEQGRVAGAATTTLDALAEGNRAYEERFGYIFIVCATGKSAEEMLAMLRARLGNEPEAELAIAAREQRAITRLRLEKLLEEAG
jgi:2-oxo-4-hydroxy-4-carboxy-5-ureidoimidazoline decarboxylase